MIKFWDFVGNSPVKLKLEGEKTLQHHKKTYDEEGYSFYGNRWYLDLDNNKIIKESTFDAVDCDGRIREYVTLECDFTKTNAGEYDPEDKEVKYPLWNIRDSSRRDQYAEMSNY